MDLFTSVLVKVFSGLIYVGIKITWFMTRIAWWLTMYLLFSLGAGVAWLARGGHGKPTAGGGSGRFLEGGSGWQDAESGTVYPVSGTEFEYCVIDAELAGQYWRRTAIARLLRRGAIAKYKFYAVSETTGTWPRAGAWCEFEHEARKNLALDDLDKKQALGSGLSADAKDAMKFNQAVAYGALEHVGVLLSRCGWEPVDYPRGAEKEHWYADRYRRKVISWDAPIAAEPPAAQVSAGQPVAER